MGAATVGISGNGSGRRNRERHSKQRGSDELRPRRSCALLQVMMSKGHWAFQRGSGGVIAD